MVQSTYNSIDRTAENLSGCSPPFEAHGEIGKASKASFSAYVTAPKREHSKRALHNTSSSIAAGLLPGNEQVVDLAQRAASRSKSGMVPKNEVWRGGADTEGVQRGISPSLWNRKDV